MTQVFFYFVYFCKQKLIGLRDICEYGKCVPKNIDSHSSKISRTQVNHCSQTTSAPNFASILDRVQMAQIKLKNLLFHQRANCVNFGVSLHGLLNVNFFTLYKKFSKLFLVCDN